MTQRVRPGSAFTSRSSRAGLPRLQPEAEDTTGKTESETTADSATPENKSYQKQLTAVRILIPLALLALLFLQLYMGARHKSSTLDEQNHIARGLAYLRTGDSRLSLTHPPLVNVICALPLLRDKSVELPLEDVSWRTSDFNRFGNQFLWVKNDSGPSIVARARVPTMILTVLLGALVFAWTYEFYGWTAAVLALSLLCFDPNILGNGGLATNDLGMTFFSFLAAYLFCRMLVKPGKLRAGVAGIGLGLALTAKFSGVFLLVALPAVALVDWLLSNKQQRTFERLKRLAVVAPVVLGAALFTLWAVYAFQVRYDPSIGLLIPARGYLDGLRFAKSTIYGSHRSFLVGMYSESGWWYYFPIAFLVKTPVPTLILLAAAGVHTIRQRDWWQPALLLTPVIVYFAFAMSGPFEIGYRHLLPVLPFLFVFTGRLVNVKLEGLKWIKCAIPALMVWLIVGTVRIYPDYLTYFNEAAGGPAGGIRILADSNIDWGQDLPGLRDYMNREKLDSIYLSYFGSAPPAAYGIKNFEPLPSYPYNYAGVENNVSKLSNPPPGVYAISVSSLQGVFFKDQNLYAWFRAHKPDAVIGHTIYVYRIK